VRKLAALTVNMKNKTSIY